jgi:4-amino-4-deoxy-L-arabinose transferase-like glycosyltransferase
VRKEWLLLALLLCATVMLLWNLGAHPLKNWDESIYAQASKEMLQTGDWLTPHWNSQPWFEKPPLYLWLTTAFFRVFGVKEFTARLPSALSGIGLVAIVYLLGRRMYSAAVGALAAVIVLTAFQIVQASRLVIMDVMLTFFIFVALYSYVRVRSDARWWYAAATAAALAFMTKGFAAIVAPAAIALATMFDGRLRSTSRKKHFWLACALGLALVTPWHIVMYVLHGRAFVNEYFSYHVLLRTASAIEGKTHRYMFYFDPFVTFFKPWWVLTPFAIALGMRDNLSPKNSRSWVVLVLGVLVFVVFTIARTQISTYIIPVYPAMAILISALLVCLYRFHRFVRPLVVGFGIFGCLFAISKLTQPYETTDPLDTPIKELALLARPTNDNDSAPLIMFGGPETSRLAPMFYSDRPVEQATAVAALPETSRLSRYIDFRPLAEITDSSGKRILIKRADLAGVTLDHDVAVIAESHGWVYGWIKKRTPNVTMGTAGGTRSNSQTQR